MSSRAIRDVLADAVAEGTGCSGAKARATVSRIVDATAEYIATHERTEIRGLGVFVWVEHRERHVNGGLFGKGVIPAYRHLKFRSQSIKRRAK